MRNGHRGRIGEQVLRRAPAAGGWRRSERRRRNFGLWLLAIGMLTGEIGIGSGTAWSAPEGEGAVTSYQGDAAHSGAVAAATLAPPLTRSWSASLGGPTSHPLVASGRVFVLVGAGDARQLVALDESTGQTEWSVALARSPSSFTRAAGRIVVQDADGHGLDAYDEATGSKVWGTTLDPYGTVGPPVAEAGVVYASSDRGSFAVDAVDGSLRWSQLRISPLGMPAVAAGMVYASSGADQMAAFDAATGEVRWERDRGLSAAPSAAPVVFAGRVFTRETGDYRVLDAATGNAVASYTATADGAFTGTTAFFLAEPPWAATAVLRAEDVVSGTVRWRVEMPKGAFLPPLAANGFVFLAAADGSLTAWSGSSGERVWTDTAGSTIATKNARPLTGLAAHGQRLLVPTDEGLSTFTGDAGPSGCGPSLCAFSLPVPAPRPGSDVDQPVSFQVDAAHTGAQPALSVVPPLVRAWGVDLEGKVSYPVSGDGAVFVTATPPHQSGGSFLYAFDLSDGRQRWGPVDLGGHFAGGLSYGDGRLYALSSTGVLRAFDPRTGAPMWSRDMAAVRLMHVYDTFRPHLVATGGRVFISQSATAAIDGATGALLWSSCCDGPPAVVNDTVYLGAHALDAETGNVRWRAADYDAPRGDHDGLAGVAVYNGRVYRDEMIREVSTGDRVGSATLHQAPAFRGSTLYRIRDRQLEATDLLGTETSWSFTGDGLLGPTPPVVVGRLVYVMSAAGRLFVIDADSGEERWTTELGVGEGSLERTSLAAIGQRLLVTANDRLVVLAPAASVGARRPGPPAHVDAVAGDGRATVSWAAPADNGGTEPVTGYVVRAEPAGRQVAVGADRRTVVLGGLPNGVAQHFTVAATNSVATGPASQMTVRAVVPRAGAWTLTPLEPQPYVPFVPATITGDGRVVGTASYGPRGYPFPIAKAATHVNDRWQVVQGFTDSNGGTGLNSAGDMTGWVMAEPTAGYTVGFLQRDGVARKIPELRSALGVDDAGIVVGYGPGDDFYHHAKTWKDGVVEDLGRSHGITAVAPGGQRVGAIDGHPYLWRDGEAVELSGGRVGTANAVSRDGNVVAGTLIDPSTPDRAFRWQRGQFAEVDLPAGVFSSRGTGVNRRGDVVGDFYYAGDQFAMVHLEGRTVAANSFLAEQGDWHLLTASGISDARQIVGVALHRSQRVAFLLEPPAPPEPLPSAAMPGPPTGVTAYPGDASVSVSWTPPGDDGGSPIAAYTLTAYEGTTAVRTVSVSATATSTVISELANGTTYTFTLRATNAVGAGSESAPSNPVTPTPPPAPPPAPRHSGPAQQAPPPSAASESPAPPASPPDPAPPAPASPSSDPERSGYWMLGSTGSVYGFGEAAYRGGPARVAAVSIVPTASGNGYWVASAPGGVHAYGDATFLGGSPRLRDGEVVTSMSAVPDATGYWLFTNHGRVFSYGSARHFGDMDGTRLNGPVLGSVTSPSGNGYYMVASDGGIFAFGDARFRGSMGGRALNRPVVGLAPDPDGAGYWLVASDGGVFAFDAPFRGSMGNERLNKPVIGMVSYGDGYLMVATDGGIFNFSTTPFRGSLGQNPPADPIVGVATVPGASNARAG